MSISTSLELFSLADLFRLIEVDRKSGRLTIQVPVADKKVDSKKIYYVWFQDGHFVAISDRLNHRGLISMIETRGWLSPLVTNQLRTLCPIKVPLGKYLQESQLLTPEQINLVFQMQLHQVYQLFELAAGSFRFDEMSELKDRIMTIPWLEMTGHHRKTTEVSLYALRLIKNWDVFVDKLPPPSLIFKRLLPQCGLKLMSLEWQLWQNIDGLNSLNTIAKQLNTPIYAVQIAAFRLLAVGLIEEIILPSLTLDTIQLNSSPKDLIRLSLPDTVLESEIIEQAQQNNHHKNQISQAKQDVQPEPKIPISNADPIQDNHLKTLSQIAKINANTSLLDDVLGLLRSRFKNS